MNSAEPELEFSGSPGSATPQKKDYGYANAQVANSLVDQGLPDDEVLARLADRGVSKNQALRFIEEAKNSRGRRQREKQYLTTNRIGIALLLTGIPLSLGGLVGLHGFAFRTGVVMLIAGAVLLSPKLDIRR